jgi:hypothetical protein
LRYLGRGGKFIYGARAHIGRLIQPFYLTAILGAYAVLCPAAATQMLDLKDTSATFDLDKDHLAIASLDGVWRFHFGDDPRFADPDYDDSAWRLVRSDQSWNRGELLPSGSNSFWYRSKVFIPASSPTLSLYIPYVETNYQIWIDGHFVGGIGGLPPHTTATAGISAAYAVPSFQPQPARQPRFVSIAIRCYKRIERVDPSSSVDAFGSGIRIGATPLIQQLVRLRTRNAFWYSTSDLFLTLLNTLAAAAAFGLFLFRRKEKEYLWYSLVGVTSALIHGDSVWITSHAYSWPVDLLVSNVLWEASSLALMIFVHSLLDGRRDRLFKIAVSSIFINLIFALANFVPYMVRPEWKFADITVYNGVSALLFLPFVVWVVTLICRRAIEGRTDARLLLPAVVLTTLGTLTGFVITSARFIFGWGPSSWDWFFVTSDWPIPFSVQNVADLLLHVTMLAVLIFRFTRTRLHEESYAREREAARTVQQVLVPDEITDIPGFAIRSVYNPFGEVGGDFFQIIPIESGRHSGSVLVIIGDVSGKGLPAAMTVSLLVGTVRTLAHYTQSPSEMLAAMNQSMVGRCNGGFTTCLILRADLDGSLTTANAGHIAPYINGSEMFCDNGFPLGITQSASYTEFRSQLTLTDQLTLITDGVVEARNVSGELFGFDRSAELATASAELIASTARNFGQDDDITVLTLSLIEQCVSA